MKKLTIPVALAIALLPGIATAQEKSPPIPPKITISANMMDVRTVINTVFAQAGKSYVLENGVIGSVNLALRDVEFDECLQILCKVANLKYEEQNGIFFISKVQPPKAQTPPKAETAPAKPVEPPKPKGKLPASSLEKKITTRFDKTAIKTIFAELTRQTGIEFEITAKVPAYKLDAYLIGTSLKFALDSITKAAGLEYKLTENQTILIDKTDPNRVKVVAEGASTTKGSNP